MPKRTQRRRIAHNWLVFWFLGWCVLLGVLVGFAQTAQVRDSSSNTPITQNSADQTQQTNTATTNTATNTLDSLTAQLEHGAQTYDLHCATCHGDTGLGFAEAKLAFPEDHRRCHYCHRRHNPSQMPLATMTPRNAFDIGEAPALVGENTLDTFGNAAALYYYSQATMPRPFPGDLDAPTYLAITVHMLHLRGAVPATLAARDQPITLEQLNDLSP